MEHFTEDPSSLQEMSHSSLSSVATVSMGAVAGTCKVSRQGNHLPKARPNFKSDLFTAMIACPCALLPLTRTSLLSLQHVILGT